MALKMTNEALEVNHPIGNKDSDTQVIEYCEQFVRHFVAIFECQLSEYSKCLDVELAQSSKWAECISKVKGIVSTPLGRTGSDSKQEISIGTGVWLFQQVVANCRNNKPSVQKLSRYLKLYHANPNGLRYELVLSAIEIFQCFESQLKLVYANSDCQSAIEKCAIDAVIKVLNHFKAKDEEFSTDGITRGLVLGKFKKYKHKSNSAPLFQYLGHNLKKDNFVKTFTQPGLVIVNDNVKKYYSRRKSNPEKYGYRLLFKWESLSSQISEKELHEDKHPEEEHEYVIVKNEKGLLAKKFLNSNFEVSELLRAELQNEARRVFKKIETLVNRNYKPLLSEIEENQGLIKKLYAKANMKKLIPLEIPALTIPFVGREDKLKEIAEELVTGIVVICGLGGMGKTELAKKYAHDHRDTYNGNVMWINAGSPITLRDSFFRLAKESLNISLVFEDRDEKSVEMIVYEVYEYFFHQKCLFVFEAAQSLQSIRKFLPIQFAPSNTRPHILITSRFSNGWKSDRVVFQKQLSLFGFTDGEARKYVGTVLNIPYDHGVDVLVKKLHNFPLALHHAVTYIKSKNEFHQNFTTNDYIAEFEKSKDSKKLTCEHAAVIYETLQVIVTSIDSKTVEMLNILSYFAPHNVPSILLLKSLFHNNAEKMDAGSEELEKYSLTKLRHGMLSMHDFVQEVRREMLQIADKEEESLREGLVMLKNKVKEYKNIGQYQPHVVSLWNHVHKYDKLIETFIVEDILKIKSKSHLNYFHLIAGGSSYEVFTAIMTKLEKICPEQFEQIICADDGQGGKPLHYAASNEDGRLMELLIAKGAEVNAKTKQGWTPLLLAEKDGKLENLKILLKCKAHVEDKTKYGITALHMAARCNYLETVSVLLSYGADVNARCKNKFTPLHYAVKMNNLEVVQLLLDQPGVDVNALTEFQLTPLIFAAKAGHLECVEALLLRGADVNASDAGGFTPLHSAACNGHLKVVSALFKDKAIDVNLRTTKGNTALHLAAEKGHFEIVKVLIAKNALQNLSNGEGKLPSDFFNVSNVSQ